MQNFQYDTGLWSRDQRDELSVHIERGLEIRISTSCRPSPKAHHPTLRVSPQYLYLEITVSPLHVVLRGVMIILTSPATRDVISGKCNKVKLSYDIELDACNRRWIPYRYLNAPSCNSDRMTTKVISFLVP